jgi:hypothetical protein
MLPTDLTILILLVSGLTFSIIELGLSAYIISVLDTYNAYIGYGANIVPGWLAFLLFASLWTIVRTLFRLIRLIRRNKRSTYDAGRQPAKWVPILTLVINAVTMIFWLSGFAAYASLLGGFAPTGIYGALLAFAVMLVSLSFPETLNTFIHPARTRVPLLG